MTSRKGFFTLLGKDPAGTGECEFKIAQEQVEHLNACGPESKFYGLFSARDVLKNPAVVFEGLNRDGQEKGLCYAGTPKCYRDGSEHPPHPGMVFLVFVTEKKTIFEWRWEREDADNLGLPLQVKTRFNKMLWKRSSTT